MKRICLMLLLLLSMNLAAGCTAIESGNENRDDYTIGVVTKSRDSEYWMSVVSGMEKAASDLHVSVMVLSPDTETDKFLQNKMIDDLLNKEIDALAISPIDSYDSKDCLEKAKEKSIAIYSFDTEIIDKDVPYIGIDNEKAGRNLAEFMAQQLQKPGKIGIISGNLMQTAHEKRMMGFRNYIETHTDMEIAFIETGYSNLQMSEQEISRLMKEHPQISGIFATSAVTALGIMEYMKGKPVLITTVDAQEDALEAVKNGGIAALASQSGFQIGYETIQYIVKDLNGAEQEQKKIIDIETITKDNVEEYQKLSEIQK